MLKPSDPADAKQAAVCIEALYEHSQFIGDIIEKKRAGDVNPQNFLSECLDHATCMAAKMNGSENVLAVILNEMTKVMIDVDSNFETMEEVRKHLKEQADITRDRIMEEI